MKAVVARLLVVLLFLTASACSTSTDVREKFVGEWKSVNADTGTHTFIRRTGDNYFITEGKQDLVATYQDSIKGLIIDNGTRKVPVLYIQDTDEIVVSAGGKSAKFSRVK
ncbi:MAG: hypothetical protein JWR44_2826 [Hymenobacter sp.]|jgi:hypothetical protein|nr:hypothetical protein [Hymenobacter sp.]